MTNNQTSSPTGWRLKNEFMEDEKYHSLMRWLVSFWDVNHPFDGRKLLFTAFLYKVSVLMPKPKCPTIMPTIYLPKTVITCLKISI